MAEDARAYIDTRNVASPDVKINKFPRKDFVRYKGSQKSSTMVKAYNLLHFDLIGLVLPFNQLGGGDHIMLLC